ncbi:TPA: TetR family transcriptional regulator, partial [Pseudomonas aeruginosa]|nr:TetR family transcriptional regulator [Pseudomonas aeruginosa]HCF2684461.1 TetR family transcriptional regulator [Pseudomonas aeruginosa]HCF2731751.1 TetR family transcriptional regulator [Pseudomonas aeruginosa]
RAGVSIGSLYQYFPNKQGLAAAVVDHYSDEVLARFTAMVRARPGKTLVDTVDAMIGFALVSHPHEPEMHRALNDLAPRIGREEKTRAISRGMAKVIETELERHRQEISPDLDLADAAAMIETVLETVAHRAIQRHPVRVGADGLIGQCRRLIIGYLRSPSPS